GCGWRVWCTGRAPGGCRPLLLSYTTLFRARIDDRGAGVRPHGAGPAGVEHGARAAAKVREHVGIGLHPGSRLADFRRRAGTVFRSEEHTSELQSRENLVCRLLLEKKK